MQTCDKSLSLRLFPDRVLRRMCTPVERFDSELRDMLNEMLILMRIHKGIGLAAPQVGITKRLFVCELEGQSLCLINPEIESMSGKTEMVEGCLSLPDVDVNVQRSEHVHVRGYDAEGHSTRFGMTGLWARVLQHEYDHLNGVLICDHDQKGSVDEA